PVCRTCRVTQASSRAIGNSPLGPRSFRETHSPSCLGSAIAPLRHVRLRNHVWNRNGTTTGVNGNEGEVARIRVATHAGSHVFGLHAHANFHGRPARVVHTRFHDHQFTNVDGLAEIHAIDGYRDAGRACMPDRGHCSRLVHHGQHRAAEHVTQDVRVRWHHDLGRFVLARTYGTPHAT